MKQRHTIGEEIRNLSEPFTVRIVRIVALLVADRRRHEEAQRVHMTRSTVHLKFQKSIDVQKRLTNEISPRLVIASTLLKSHSLHGVIQVDGTEHNLAVLVLVIAIRQLHPINQSRSINQNLRIRFLVYSTTAPSCTSWWPRDRGCCRARCSRSHRTRS